MNLDIEQLKKKLFIDQTIVALKRWINFSVPLQTNTLIR